MVAMVWLDLSSLFVSFVWVWKAFVGSFQLVVVCCLWELSKGCLVWGKIEYINKMLLINGQLQVFIRVVLSSIVLMCLGLKGCCLIWCRISSF